MEKMFKDTLEKATSGFFHEMKMPLPKKVFRPLVKKEKQSRWTKTVQDIFWR
jgi:hypothetical protein